LILHSLISNVSIYNFNDGINLLHALLVWLLQWQYNVGRKPISCGLCSLLTSININTKLILKPK